MARFSSNKAQIFTMDVVLATALLLLIVAMELAFWNTYIYDIETRQGSVELQRATFDASNYLVRERLVSKPNVFDTGEVLGFVSGNYNQTRHELGVSGFEFYFKLEDSGGDILQLNSTDIEFGENFSNSEDLAVARRIGLIDINGTKTEVISYIYLWT
jgi:hypothetical protein